MIVVLGLWFAAIAASLVAPLVRRLQGRRCRVTIAPAAARHFDPSALVDEPSAALLHARRAGAALTDGAAAQLDRARTANRAAAFYGAPRGARTDDERAAAADAGDANLDSGAL
jgi:hypothetical protein